MADHNGETFNTADLAWKMFAGDTFTTCVFHGSARSSNFQGAAFTDCTFDEDFAFDGCQLTDVTGLPDKYVVPTVPNILADTPVEERGDRAAKLQRMGVLQQAVAKQAADAAQQSPGPGRLGPPVRAGKGITVL
jgi:hypothetical protein